MTASEVTVDQFTARLGPDQQRDVQAHLTAGRGVACYVDRSGAPRLIRSFGPRGADIIGLPPRTFGQADWELGAYVPPPSRTGSSMRSPLLDGVGGPPQIKAPPRAPSETLYPEVLVGGRSSSHPRGHAEFLNLTRGRTEPEPVEPSQPITAEAAWWRDNL
jgi:hypothetical protein